MFQYVDFFPQKSLKNYELLKIEVRNFAFYIKTNNKQNQRRDFYFVLS